MKYVGKSTYDENMPLGALTIKQFKELMISIQNQTSYPPAAPEEEFLKMKEVLAILKISRSSLFSWKKRGIIKSRMISGSLYFIKSEIIKLMDTNNLKNENKNYI